MTHTLHPSYMEHHAGETGKLPPSSQRAKMCFTSHVCCLSGAGVTCTGMTHSPRALPAVILSCPGTQAAPGMREGEATALRYLPP